MEDLITVEIGSEPLVLTFGKADKKHIVATIWAKGALTWQTVSDYDYDLEDNKKWQVTRHELLDEKWESSPTEAESVFELRDGPTVLETYVFPHLNSPAHSQKEDEISANWTKVLDFAKAHNFEWQYLEGEVCQHCLEEYLSEEHSRHLKSIGLKPVAAPKPVRLEPSRELSA